MEKKNNNLVIILMGLIIVVLAVLCVLFATGIVKFDNMSINDVSGNNDSNNNQSISLSADDYISIEKVDIGDELYSIEKINFKNLDSSLTQKFYEEQQKMIDSVYSKKNYLSRYNKDELKGYYVEETNNVAVSSIWYQANKNILTVYVEIKQGGELGVSVDTNVLNIDLKNKKIVNNKELFEKVNYSYRDIAEKEYERTIESCLNVSDRSYCYFDKNDKEITLEQHKTNKESFISNIENNCDQLIKAYIQDGKVKYDYRPLSLREVNETLHLGGPFGIASIEVGEYK